MSDFEVIEFRIEQIDKWKRVFVDKWPKRVIFGPGCIGRPPIVRVNTGVRIEAWNGIGLYREIENYDEIPNVVCFQLEYGAHF